MLKTAYMIEKNRKTASYIDRKHHPAENYESFHEEVKHPLSLEKWGHWRVMGTLDQVHCKEIELVVDF